MKYYSIIDYKIKDKNSDTICVENDTNCSKKDYLYNTFSEWRLT